LATDKPFRFAATTISHKLAHRQTTH
jgi:hypothetical protein